MKNRILPYVTAALARPVCLLAALLLFLSAKALPADTYASASVLSTGRWVKISVPRSGVYAINASTLRSWGFSNPSNVRIYGYGAYRTADILNSANYLDDLPMVQSALTTDNKVVFYARGPETWRSPVSGRFVANQNFYTNVGYYYVTESDQPSRAIEKMGRPEASSPAGEFIERLQHEQELVSPGEAGGFLMGEDFRFTPQRQFTFNMPGRNEDGMVWMECSFVAKTYGQTSQLTFAVNGQQLDQMGTDIISKTDANAHYHGTEGLTRRTLTDIKGEKLTVDIRHTSSVTIHGAWLNYLAVNYVRKLDMATSDNGILSFGTSNSALRLSSADASTTVWDVTDIFDVKRIETGDAGGGVIQWTNSYGGQREYAIWRDNARFPAPDYVGTVANQNLHAMESVNMVIISPSAWLSQCGRIAEIHRGEGLTVAIVNADQIYNEFGSGSPDVLAIRRFLKMLYDRGDDAGTPLRYCLLMGCATVDNRHNTAEMKDAAPTLPVWLGGTLTQSLNDSDGFTTDDFIAMLADDSGINKGWDDISIAVGRIPVRSAAEASTYIDKLTDYVYKSKQTTWKNQIMMLADDDDQGIHMSQSETMVREFSTDQRQQYIHNKVYIDAYDRIGGIYPKAREEMFRYLNEGVLLWTYIGHANNHSMTGDGQITFNDLNNMYLKHVPILYAATCDFLRWDSATLSGGELLFHERFGGVIAAISATRPVYIYDNGLFSGAIGRQFAARENDGRYGTIGDVYRRAKNDIRAMDSNGNFTSKTSNSNRLRYVLMGDPAMRLLIPDNIVTLNTIDDRMVSDVDRPEIAARQTVVFKGVVTTPDGVQLDDYNGTLNATIYDAERSTTTNGYGEHGVKYTYEEMGGKVYAGATPIVNGHYELRVTLPADIADNYRPATINMYAVPDKDCQHAEAIGVSHNFYICGYDDTAEPDVTPPVIDSFVLNHPTFTEGERVNSTPLAMAHVSDDQGLNLSTSGIGHNMRLTVDGSQHFNDVAQYFTPSSDGSPSGTINYPLSDLREGPHELTLRIWDIDGNSTEKTISFMVDNTVSPRIFDIYSDANPATTTANFYLSHDRPDQMLTVTVTVYNLLGAPIWNRSVTGVSDMFLSTPVSWDLCDASGKRVPRGIYLYKATITSDGEHFQTKTHRIAVAN